MEYLEVIAAIVILVAVIVFASFNPPTSQPLADADAISISQNYIATNYPGSTVLNTAITERNLTSQHWKITINYKQQTAQGCTLARCYWEGPASQYCRQESNLSLGNC